MSNYPPDWYAHYSTCSLCGERYHASGEDECDCQPCERCNGQVPPWRPCADCGHTCDEMWVGYRSRRER